MESKNAKIAELVRKELSSVKVMILAIMMSFGVVLFVVQALANVFYTYEILSYVKDFLRIPYDAKNNEMISLAMVIVWIIQFIMFLIPFILLMFMTYGVYNIYGDARYAGKEPKTKGLKVVGGVMKYYGIMAYALAGLFIALGIVILVGAFGFADKISVWMGFAPSEMAMELKILAVVCVVVIAVTMFLYIGIGTVYMSLNKCMKFMANIQKGKREAAMEAIGIVLMFVVGISNLTSIFTDLSSSGYTAADIEEMEMVMGGTVTEILVNMMPSANTQFRVAVIGCAYAFFIGMAEVLGAITLWSIRKKSNKILEEQEVANYGGEDFTGSNQC